MLLGTAITGLLMGFLAGQPILIVGGTGPLLVYEEALFQVEYISDISGMHEYNSLHITG